MSEHLTPSRAPVSPEPDNEPMNPYLAGTLLGLTLLASFLILGAGLGASAGIARLGAQCQLLIAPEHVAGSEYFGAWGGRPLNYYLSYMLAGTFLGGFLSALVSRRITVTMERGASFGFLGRAVLTFAGGVIVGFASRLAQGCTSGQALTGSALLLTGSLVFLVCVFAGGYGAAWFFRRQWHD
ncbi:MAG TPA: YeeE/YedE thiosulfate transporter family protein [Candidatus Ozemobacteraceae bacterium]|nr:YeeE/YedE thiosulfate transporter family protein [Candidatus Ozemobacteraceae bacterium]